MKICHMEAMKEIRALEEQKNMLIEDEARKSTVSYKEGEKSIPTDYSYVETRAKIAELDEQVRKIRHALAQANCSVRLDSFDMTIGEGLVMLAQWNAEYERLSELACRQQITRRITANGVLEYTECLYCAGDVQKDCKKLRRKISALQVAIDRANLTSTLEI